MEKICQISFTMYDCEDTFSEGKNRVEIGNVILEYGAKRDYSLGAEIE
jgi:hypothetical protein